MGMTFVVSAVPPTCQRLTCWFMWTANHKGKAAKVRSSKSSAGAGVELSAGYGTLVQANITRKRVRREQ